MEMCQTLMLVADDDLLSDLDQILESKMPTRQGAKQMKLIFIETGNEVRLGDIAHTFRGEKVKVVGIDQPHKSSSTGRVTVEFSDGDRGAQSFFPGVIEAKWIDREDRA